MVATVKGTPKKKSRKRAPYLTKTQPHIVLSSPSLRAAVRQLLELAVAYEASQRSTNFSRNHAVQEELGFRHTAGVLKSKKTLETILTLLDGHQREKKQRAVQGQVAEVLPRVCGWLRDPQTAAPDGRLVDVTYLRSRIADELKTGDTELPSEALHDLMKLARFPKIAPRRERVLTTQNTKAEGALPHRVATILKKRKVVACSPDTLSNIRYASEGGRTAGAVKTPEEARALRENAWVAPQELVLYTLLLLTDGQRTDLVDEPMAALRAVVARHHEAGPRALADPPEGQSASTITASETGPTSPRPEGDRSSS